MSMDWWARKLNANKSAAPPRPMPSHPVPPAYPQPQAQPQPQPQQDREKVTIDNLWEAMGTWTGGQGNRESSTCPNCGSDLYFSSSNTSGVYSQNGHFRAPPRCYACGFKPGHEMQGQPR